MKSAYIDYSMSRQVEFDYDSQDINGENNILSGKDERPLDLGGIKIKKFLKFLKFKTILLTPQRNS